MLRSLRAEILKLRRSSVPIWTALVVLGWPLFSIGSIRLANGSFGATTWESMMGMPAQSIASWYGVLLGGFVTAYLFGREYSEETVRNMLALPVRREYFIASKLIVLVVWVFSLTVLSVAAHVAYSAILGLDGFTGRLVTESLGHSTVVTLAIVATMPFVGWLAMVGRGYLAPMIFSSVAFLSGIVMLQVGWERWYPWAMPFALAGLTWIPISTKSSLVAGSWAILAGVFVTGAMALIVQIDYADCLE